MKKNKKNKLTIKSNWDKALTLSPQEKKFLIAGNGGDDDDDDCPSRPVGAPKTMEDPFKSVVIGCKPPKPGNDE